jgi:small subunit ribosomal protein S16
MALTIHLSSSGRHGQRLFRIIVSEKNGKAKDYLGYYNPKQKDSLTLDKNKYQTWIAKGALPSISLNKIIKESK